MRVEQSNPTKQKIRTEKLQVPIYRRIDIPLLLAGLIVGIISLTVDAWWTLQGVGSNQIILIQASPFFLQIQATGLPTSVPGAAALGDGTRFLIGFSSILLIVSSVKQSVWWKNLAGWLNLAAIVEMFLSFAIMIGIARQVALAGYGASVPVAGTATLPFNMLGLDLNFYATPTVSAGFSPIFYAGIASLALVTYERLMSLKIFGSFQGNGLGTIREMTLAPPYDRVWVATDDTRMNPLSDDPAFVADDRLATSLWRMYDTVSPGGIVTILLPTWASWVGDKIKNFVDRVGFKLDSSELIEQDGEQEMELVLRKPGGEKEPVVSDQVTETVKTETETKGPSTPPSVPEPTRPVPPTLSIELKKENPTPEWTLVPTQSPVGPGQVETPVPPSRTAPTPVPVDHQRLHEKTGVTKREQAMVRTAARLISSHGSPMGYRELLNDVYLDLLEHRVEFESAREIERVLTAHVGHELVLIEEATPDGRINRRWWIGDESVGKGSAEWPFLGRLKRVPAAVEDRAKSLKKRFSHADEGYHTRKMNDEDSSGRT